MASPGQQPQAQIIADAILAIGVGDQRSRKSQIGQRADRVADSQGQGQLADHFGRAQAGQKGQASPGAGRIDDIPQGEPRKPPSHRLIFLLTLLSGDGSSGRRPGRDWIFWLSWLIWARADGSWWPQCAKSIAAGQGQRYSVKECESTSRVSQRHITLASGRSPIAAVRYKRKIQ